MARGWNMDVRGLRELENIMVKELPNTVARRTLLSAIRASAKPMQEAAKSKVVKTGSGALAESIGLKTIRNRGNNKEFASMALAPMSGKLGVWAKYKDFYGDGRGSTASGIQSGSISVESLKAARIRHGHLVEFGFMHKGGRNKKGKITRVAPQPFLRPAFDQESGGFANNFRGYLAPRVERAVKKIRSKNDAAIRSKR